MDFVSFISHAFVISLFELVYLVGVILVIGFILGVMEDRSKGYLTRTFGKYGNLLTAWIGTPIHEIGHWIQCKIWRHQVVSVKLLQLDDPDGIMGYVEHKYNPKSVYQRIGNFFIGIGPIFSGIGSIILLMLLLVPESFAVLRDQIGQYSTSQFEWHQLFQLLGESVLALGSSLFTPENMTKPLFWIFVFISICISSHIALSRADIHNSFQGLLMIYILLFLVNITAGIFRVDTSQMIHAFAEINAYILAFSSVAVLFSFVSLVLSFLLYKLIR